MKTLGEYKALFGKKGIEISENDIQKIIDEIHNIGNLLFKRYKTSLLSNIKRYENK